MLHPCFPSVHVPGRLATPAAAAAARGITPSIPAADTPPQVDCLTGGCPRNASLSLLTTLQVCPFAEAEMSSAEVRRERRGGALPSVNAAAPTGMGALQEPYTHNRNIRLLGRI